MTWGWVIALVLTVVLGHWSGITVERDRQERRRRANIRARYNHPSNR